MSDSIFHIRIMKPYAAALMEDLVKAGAIEFLEETDVPAELTPAQKSALDKELETIAANPDYLLKWEDVKYRIKKH